MHDVTGRPGELDGRLLDLVDDGAPQVRAVATTLLIKAIDVGVEEGDLLEAMVASDQAAAMIDPVAAAQVARRLRRRLGCRLAALADRHGEATVVRALRDHLVVHMQRWATRAVDDTDNRRRAERLLAWAERPDQLRAAQRRGLFAGMDAGELRRLAASRVEEPISAEVAVGIWADVQRWSEQAERLVGEPVLAAWETGPYRAET